MHEVVAFTVGFISSLIGAISTGANLISIPGLIFLGVSPISTIATTRLSAVSGGLTTVYRYNKGNAVRWHYLPYFIPIAVIGGLIGPRLLLLFNQNTVRPVIGILLLTSLPLIFVKPEFGTVPTQRSRSFKFFGILALLIVMVYATMFSIGGGIFMLYTLVYFYGMTIAEANATGNAVWLLGAFTALVAYITKGQVNFSLGIPLLIGAALGGYIGANIALKKGAKWVKVALAITLIASSIKLIL